MKGYGVGFRAVGICLLFLGAKGVASAQSEFSGFKMETDVVSAPKFTTHFGVQLTEAKVRYERNFSTRNNKSKWDAWMTRGDLSAAIYHQNNMGLEIGFGVFTTTTNEENWTRSGQQNDTNFDGWELKLGLGWLHDFEGQWKVKQLLSYGHRIMEFDLRDFELTTDDGTQYIYSVQVDEKLTLDYFEYSPHFTAEVKEKWSFSFKPGLAYVVFSEADNSHPDYGTKIKGEWGLIASTEARLGYQFTEGFAGYIGAIGEWQYLEGDTTQKDGTPIEWPDNDLFTYGLRVGLVFDL